MTQQKDKLMYKDKLMFFATPTHTCPVHGDTHDTIISTIPGHEGIWCMVCCLEMLDRKGVCRMTEITDEKPE